MENEELNRIFKSLCFPEKKLKSIKFKRFLKQMNDQIDFTDMDILLSRIHNNYSDKKLSLETFVSAINHLIQTQQLSLQQISDRFEERLSLQEE
jgi:hypothetical protein